MGLMPSKLEDAIVALDFTGRWTPQHQTAARHTNALFVEVSKDQFYAAIGPRDIISSPQGRGKDSYITFKPRYSAAEIGRVYSDGAGIVATRYLLTPEFAATVSCVLEAA